MCADLKTIGGLMKHNKWQKETTSNEMQEVSGRLARNRKERIPSIIKKIEHIYKLMYMRADIIHQLNNQLDFLCPVVWNQEKKLREVNKAFQDDDESRFKVIRAVGREVDAKLLEINAKLGGMALHIKRELEVAGRIPEV